MLAIKIHVIGENVFSKVVNILDYIKEKTYSNIPFCELSIGEIIPLGMNEFSLTFGADYDIADASDIVVVLMDTEKYVKSEFGFDCYYLLVSDDYINQTKVFTNDSEGKRFETKADSFIITKYDEVSDHTYTDLFDSDKEAIKMINEYLDTSYDENMWINDDFIHTVNSLGSTKYGVFNLSRIFVLS